jgi:ribokinase
MKYQFVALGDITTDAFVRLVDAEDHTDHGNRTLCMRFGDKVAYENVYVVKAVGNSPNAAVAAHRLGLRSSLVSTLGDDRSGKECIDTLKQQGVSAEYVRVQPGSATNYHFVLWFKEERTILIKHERYDYTLPNFPEAPEWLYFSSIGEHSLPFHATVVEYLRARPETKLAFQPGTFQMKMGLAALKDVYACTTIFFCNKQEAQRILSSTEEDCGKLAQLMRSHGPKTAVITDGPMGAWGVDESGTYFVPMYPDPSPPKERTGAGDAFSSTVTACLALGKPLKDALLYGPVNSMNVVQYIGAQEGLLSLSEIEVWLSKKPAHYIVSKID